MERVLEDRILPRRRETDVSLGVAFALMETLLVAAPFAVYPVFVMKALCFALFACAFNLLIRYVGLISFGHAMFFGWASARLGANDVFLRRRGEVHRRRGRHPGRAARPPVRIVRLVA